MKIFIHILCMSVIALVDCEMFTLSDNAEGETVTYSDTKYCNLTVPKIIETYGYPAEVHQVVVQGYILELHRIPKGVKEPETPNGKPVLLQHGMHGSSINFIQLPTDKALAFVLADEGYDVWLSNARGSKYSRKHETLNPDVDMEYWDFSWHEMGKFDVPAIIDYILSTTRHEKLFYIGHSMGNTMFYVGMVENPSYNDKIQLQISFAPAGIMTNSATAKSKCLEGIMNTEGQRVITGGEIMRDGETFLRTQGRLCDMDDIPDVCKDFQDDSCFMASSVSDLNEIWDKACQLPAGSSVKSAQHFMQAMKVDYLPKFDYGVEKNNAEYGQDVPPKYDFALITAPVLIYYGEEDHTTTAQDITTLSTMLPNLKELYNVKPGPFGHSDFIFADNAYDVVYTKVIEDMKNMV